MSQPLNRYSIRRVVSHLSLSDKYRRVVDQLLKLVDEKGTVRVATLQSELFPFQTPASANNSINRLLQVINDAAESSGVTFSAHITANKKAGATGRSVWFEGSAPMPGLSQSEELDSIPSGRLIMDQQGAVPGAPVIVLLTFNEYETQAVLNEFGQHGRPVENTASPYYELGHRGGARVLLRISRQGVSAAQQAAEESIRLFSPRALIGVGIAFGTDESKQSIGDVLVSTAVKDYELRKVNNLGIIESRGHTPPASPLLVNRFIDLQHVHSSDGIDGFPKIQDGVLLSGNALVDNLDYRESLIKFAGIAVIGGEMEGLGLHVVALNHDVHWIVVKAVCDFGDGNKGAVSKERDQRLAAKHAALVVRTALDMSWLYAPDITPGPATPVEPPQLPPFTDSDDHWVANRGEHTNLNKDSSAPQPRAAAGVDVMDRLMEWTGDPASPSAFALLGEYGMGKTVTSQRFARHLRELRAEDPTTPLSLYFDLREVTGLDRGVPTIDQIVEEVMKRSWPAEDLPAYTMENFQSWISQPAVVIFDGLDEVLVKFSAGDGQTFTRTLLSLAPRPGDARHGRLKVMVSCRTHYFKTLRLQLNHFTGQERGNMRADSFSALILLPFDEGQVRTYLSSAFPDQDPDKLLEMVRSVHDLIELTARPYTLSLVARFLPEIERDRADGKPVYGVSLYRRIANAWLERDDGKHQLRAEDKQLFTASLAAHMWAERETSLPIRVIEGWFRAWLDSDAALRSRYASFHPDRLEEDLRAATFLARTDTADGSTFRFAHTSLQEYFLATHLVEAIRSNSPEQWALPILSIETFDFIGQLLAESNQPQLMGTLSSWSAPYRPQSSENLLAYAGRSIGRGWPVPILRGLDMSGAHLDNLKIPAPGPSHASLDLSRARFGGASLQRTSLHHVNLDGADFAGANLHQAYFLDCSLISTRFTATDLTSVVFRDCILTKAKFNESDTRGAQQLRCADPEPSFLAVPTYSGAVQSPSDRLCWNAVRINMVVFSPDGTLLATAGIDGTARLWNTATGAERSVLTGHVGVVRSVVFSPDGALLATAGEDDTARLWNANTGAERSVLTGHTGGVRSVVFSPDGALLATAGDDDTARLWDANTGAERSVLTGHTGWVRSVVFSPDGALLATAGIDGTARLWDTATGAERSVLTGHTGWVRSVAFSPDGGLLATAGDDGTVRLWDTSNRTERTVLTGGFRSVVFSPDGTLLATAGDDGTARLWDTATGTEQSVLAGHTGWVRSVVFSPDGALLATAGIDGTVRLWDMGEGAERTVLTGHTGGVRSVVFSHDGALLATAGNDGTARLWDMRTGVERTVITVLTGGVLSVVFSPEGALLATAGDDDAARLWDIATGAERTILSGRVRCVVFSPDGVLLATVGDDGAARLWDVVSGAERRVLTGHTGWVRSVVFSPDGRLLATAGNDGTARLWDANSGAERTVLSMLTGGVRSVVFSPDGRRLATAGDDRTARLWNANTGTERIVLTGHTGWVRSVMFSPDGTLLATAGDDRTARLWDANTGTERTVLTGHTGGVRSVVFSPDGTLLATAGDDRTARLWDVVTGAERTVLTGHTGGVRSVVFSPDGTLLATAGDDGTARLWDLSAGNALLAIGFVSKDPLSLGGYAIWRPFTNELLGISGEGWRSLFWERDRTGELPVRLPGEYFGSKTGTSR